MKTRQKTIIYLKHPAIPRIEFQNQHSIGWQNIAEHSTLCWTSITKNMKVTDDMSKVTCKKCLKIIAKNKRDVMVRL